MSKYFDKLVKINESLGKEIERVDVHAENNFEYALKKYSKSLSPGDCLVWAFNIEMRENEKYAKRSIDDVSLAEFSMWLTSPAKDSAWVKSKKVVSEDDSESISMPKDSLTDDQKKDLLKDKGVDAKIVDGMKDSKELDSALDATLNNDEIKKESVDGSLFVIRMDDNDIDKHGYIEMRGSDQLTDEESDAARFDSESEANDEIVNLCEKFHFDQDTLSVVQYEDNEVLIDDTETWVSLDPTNPSATTLG